MKDFDRSEAMSRIISTLIGNKNNEDFEYVAFYTRGDEDSLHAIGEMCTVNLISVSFRMLDKALSDLPLTIRDEMSVDIVREFLSRFKSEILARAITIDMLSDLTETELMEYLG